jgi:PAS domain S-box-containing protein
MGKLQLFRGPAGFARAAACLASLPALLGLAGWTFDVPILTSVLRDLPMAPITAGLLLLLSISIWLLAAPENLVLWRKRMAQVSGLVVALAGALFLAEHLFGATLSLDRVFPSSSASVPGHPAVLTGAVFLLFGLALILFDLKPRVGHWPIDLLIVIPIMISLLALIGYACNVPPFYGWRSLFPNAAMSLPTAASCVALGAGLLAAQSGRGLTKVLASGTTGGVVARRLLLAPVLIPLLTGLVRIELRRIGFYNDEFAFWFFAFLNIFIFTLVIWWIATLLFHADTIRQGAEAQVLELNAGLERRVAERTGELRLAKESLQEKEERLRRIIDTALDAVITIDPAGAVTGWSRQAETIFGWPAAEILGRNLSQTIIPARHRAEHEAGLKHFLQTQSGPVLHRRIEMPALRRDGTEIPVELAITPFQVRGQYIFSAFLRDITERKLAEEKLQAQLGRLDLLHRITRAIAERQDLRSIFQAVIRRLEEDLPIDFGCVCLYEAPAAFMTVYTMGARSESLAIEPALAEQSQVAIDQNGLSRCVSGQLVYEPDLAGVNFPFPERLARAGLRAMVAAPLLVESRVFGVLVAARRDPESFSSGDCEFLKQLSEHAALAAHQARIHTALQQAYDELRQSHEVAMQQERLRALGQMASGIAHDINNALSPAALYLESLLEREPGISESGRTKLQIIERAVGDVAATVGRMREFYRPREPELVLAAVNLNGVVRQVLELSRARWSDMPQLRGSMIAVVADLARDLPAIPGIESELREAFLNLIFNAVDAMPEGGMLTIRTKLQPADPASAEQPSPGRIWVEVSDTGVGMSEETRRRCLEPFYTTKGERGTGLGLAMVYGAAQRHGAAIEIESAAGEGTRVRLGFGVDSKLAPGVAAEPVGRLPARMRLLIVDDDPVVLKSLRDVLESDGHVVVAANEGAAGIEAFKKALETGEPFDLVLSDLGMPYLDGRQVAAAVKAASPTTPVILLTGWGQRLADEGEIPAGVDLVLSKPPKLQDLRQGFAKFQRKDPAPHSA